MFNMHLLPEDNIVYLILGHYMMLLVLVSFFFIIKSSFIRINAW
ncbi:hypothetical protein VAE308_1010268 [Vibrio aestuarianus]|nr:hypothetical protein VAE308_1010268 [Vibrio aestuarianus]